MNEFLITDLGRAIIQYLILWFIIEEMDTKMHTARPSVANAKADSLWHKLEGTLKVVLFIMVWYYNNIPIEWITRYWIIIVPVAYFISNLYWNIRNNQKWYYAGDGKGTWEEDVITWLVGDNEYKRIVATLAWKAIMLIIGIFYAILYNQILNLIGIC